MKPLNCTECFHCVVLEYANNAHQTLFQCQHLKPKSRVVELPCEVGHKVWFVKSTNWQQTEWKVAEGKLSMIQQKADKSWKVRISHNSSVWDIILDAIGKEYFLSREEAENALAERSKK